MESCSNVQGTFIFQRETYVVGTYEKRLAEGLQMSTHNLCFYREISKLLFVLEGERKSMTALRWHIRSHGGNLFKCSRYIYF